MTFRTGDNFTEPEWQAEPVEAATSFHAIQDSDPILPTKLTFSVLGKHASAWQSYMAAATAKRA